MSSKTSLNDPSSFRVALSSVSRWRNCGPMPAEPCGGTLAAMEREYIIRVLSQTGGVVSAAASHLGLPRTTLNALMRRLGISRLAL